MNIKLNWLKIQNFKGIKNFTLRMEGKNATVYGDNGTGKTTQMDAFLWLLFNKDSTDRTSFKVKPQDAEGNDIHNLQTEVEAELTVDGIPLLLRKMQEEKWTKRRGSAETELTGNTVLYWINDVPAKEGEYKAKIGSLVDENIFRMITNPMYFNGVEKWQKRREIILEMCGDVSDEEVIDNDKALARLKELLGGHSVEDYEKIVKEKIKRLKKERADIPPRIDELTLALPQQEIDYADTERQLKAEETTLIETEHQISDAAKRTNIYMKKQQDLFRLKEQLQNAKDEYSKKCNAERLRLMEERGDLEERLPTITSRVIGLQHLARTLSEQIIANGEKRNRLLSQWREYVAEKKEIEAREFIGTSEKCSYCGQAMPLGVVEESFAKIKRKDLERINDLLGLNEKEGIALKERTDELKVTFVETASEVEGLQNTLENLNSLIEGLARKIDATHIEVIYSQDDTILSLSEKISTLQSELEKPVEDITSQLIMQKNSIQEKINVYNFILHNKKKVEETNNRISELMDEEKRISALITDFEGQEFLLEQFVVSKVNYLEDKINSHFRHVKFKMFEQQINGGIAETCIAMVNTNGVYVPFTDANHAGKVNAGLDCINALGAFYEVTAPIFIDFRESVSRIIDTNSQVINLYKNEADKVLKVEVEL